ncbi:MAG: hypothetical protein IIA67_08005 [Planctomycetes bacterium]|nr:hypothetical protein [Planctomycetota bacterium]
MVSSIRDIMRQKQEDLVGHEDVTRKLAAWVYFKVGDVNMNRVISDRVARLLQDHLLQRSEIDELLDTVETKRKSGELRKPGAYFVVSLKRIYQREEISWRASE